MKKRNLLGLFVLGLFLFSALVFAVFDADDSSNEALILNLSGSEPYDSLVAYWNFDADDSSILLDFSGTGNDGTYQNGASVSSIGKFDNGSVFESSSSDYISIPNSESLNLSGNFSISFWINYSDTTANQGILSKVSGNYWNYNFYKLGSSIYFGIYDTSNIVVKSSPSGLNDNQWHHIVGTRTEGDGIYVYTDNSKSTKGADTTTGAITSTASVTIGKQSVNYFDGHLDEIMIFNKTLSDEEVAEIYMNQSGRFQGSEEYNIASQEWGGGDSLNVTSTYEQNEYTNITLSLGYFNGSWQNTASQVINGNNQFDVVGDVTNYTLNFTFNSNENSSYTPILYSYNEQFNPFTELISPADNSSFEFASSQGFICSARYLTTISNISLVSNYNQSWGILSTKVLGKGDKGEPGIGNTISLTNNGASPTANASASESYQTSYANLTLDNTASPPSYWQPFGASGTKITTSNPEWIQFDLNDSYAITRVVQDWHSADFGINYYEIEISNDNETWTQVVFNDSSTSVDKDDTFDAVNGRYVKITAYNESGEYYASLYEVDIYGKVLDTSISNNITVTFTETLSNGSYSTDYNWTCVSVDESSNEYYADENRTFSLENCEPNVTYFYNYPTNLTGSGNVYLTCNITDVSTPLSSLDVEMQYRQDDSSEWTNVSGENLNEPYVIYSIGDSIVQFNYFQTSLDALMGSNSSVRNESNSSQKLYNFGIGGNTCGQVYSRWNDTIPEDVAVIVLCGINGLPTSSVTSTTNTMEAITNNALARNNTLIWLTVGTAGNWSVNGTEDQKTVATKIPQINDWLLTNLSVRKDISVVDTYSRLYNGTHAVCEPGLCNSDGLHPNTAGGEVMARAIFEEAFNNQTFNSFIANFSTSTYNEDKIYDFRCRADDGEFVTEWLYSNDSFTLFTEYEEQPSNGGSSSGSSGSENLGSSENFFGETKKAIFGFHYKFSYGGDSHEFILRQINRANNTAEIDVYSDKKIITIKEGESENVDLDADGEYDIVMTLEKIYEDSVAVDLKVEDYAKEVEEIIRERVEDSNDALEDEFPITVWVGLLVVIIALVIIYLNRK